MLPAPKGTMLNQNETAFPDSPIEMASWVRDRSMKIVEELTKVVAVLRDDPAVTDDLPSSLHLPVSAALANAIKLAAFSSGHHLSEDELASLVGSIWNRGSEAYDELVVRLASLEEPVSKRLYGRH